MKKVLLLSLIAFTILVPFNAFGQNKGKTASTQTPARSTADTVSYALGINITQGLPQYLTQLEVLADTSGITDKAKLQSIKLANSQNLDRFIAGFKEGMNVNQEDKAYNTGLSVASQLSTVAKRMSKEILGDEESINMDLFISAFISTMKNERKMIKINDPNALIEEKRMEMQKIQEAKAQQELKAQYSSKIASEAKFLAANKKKKGVVTLPSGLQYKITTKGNGVIPKANDKVKVHYHGTLIDGTVFDSSVNRGQPIEFRVGQLIKGFNEALLMMPQGSKWTVYIPYDLAYGGADQGEIKPFSSLIFDIELLEVEPQNTAK